MEHFLDMPLRKQVTSIKQILILDKVLTLISKNLPDFGTIWLKKYELLRSNGSPWLVFKFLEMYILTMELNLFSFSCSFLSENSLIIKYF